MSAVIEFKPMAESCMAAEELRQRYTQIKEGKKDPLLAKLFYEARQRGLTQEQIASILGLTQSYISNLLTFGEWIIQLENIAMAINPEFRLHEVSERKFRAFWQKRRGLSDNDRRRAVLEDLIEHQKEQERHNPNRYVQLVKALKDHGLVNSREYLVETIARKIDLPLEEVKTCLIRLEKYPAHGIQAESINKTTKNKFKLHRASGKKVDPAVVLGTIQDHLDELKAMGKLHPVRLVPDKIRGLAILIERLIKAMES